MEQLLMMVLFPHKKGLLHSLFIVTQGRVISVDIVYDVNGNLIELKTEEQIL